MVRRSTSANTVTDFVPTAVHRSTAAEVDRRRRALGKSRARARVSRRRRTCSDTQRKEFVGRRSIAHEFADNSISTSVSRPHGSHARLSTPCLGGDEDDDSEVDAVNDRDVIGQRSHISVTSNSMNDKDPGYCRLSTAVTNGQHFRSNTISHDGSKPTADC